MKRDTTRRQLLRVAAAGTASGLLVGGGSAAGGPPERIVGTTGERGSEAARDRADEVKRTLRFGDIGQAVAGRFSDQAARKLRKRDDVRYVEDNGEMRALAQSVPYGISKVDADLAVSDGSTGDGVPVAVIDTGIDAQHEDLGAHLGAGKAFVNCSTSAAAPTAAATTSRSVSSRGTTTTTTGATAPGRSAPSTTRRACWGSPRT